MDIWKALLGVVLVVIGIAVLWHGYSTTTSCNSVWGKLGTAIDSIFGGSAAQNCYNAGLQEIAGIIVAIIGLVVIFVGNDMKHKK
jgi:multisubunit Na+/H+ antiporter MnhB subunit